MMLDNNDFRNIGLPERRVLHHLIMSLHRNDENFLFYTSAYYRFLYVRMAEWSKAPDSRVILPSYDGAFWSTNVGVGSNPTPDTF